jgi:hypothetical protein
MVHTVWRAGGKDGGFSTQDPGFRSSSNREVLHSNSKGSLSLDRSPRAQNNSETEYERQLRGRNFGKDDKGEIKQRKKDAEGKGKREDVFEQLIGES